MQYRAEMGFSHAELHRDLPAAVHPYQLVRESEQVYLITQSGRTARLTMSRQRTRTIAALTLPVTDVEIHFANFTEAQYTAFMARFRMYLQRGGG